MSHHFPLNVVPYVCGITNVIVAARQPLIIRIQVNFSHEYIIQFKENETQYLLHLLEKKCVNFYGLSKPFILMSKFILLGHADERN